MTFLVTGSNGQLGKELSKLLDENQLMYQSTDKSNLDITNKEQVCIKFNEIRPSIVFHCAAFTSVDMAEDESKELNYSVNVLGTKNIAEACKEVDATMIYISTDYVFNGQKKGDEYKEIDDVSPLNEYGKAKLLGEEAVVSTLDKYFIIRTSWVFGEFGKNFVFTMQRLAETHDTLTVVNDQFGRPTWTRSLAEFMVYVTTHKVEYGTYHFSNDNSCTWFEFAEEILKDNPVLVTPVDSSSFPQKATRPKYSVMSLAKAKATGFNILTWQEALSEMLEGNSNEKN